MIGLVLLAMVVLIALVVRGALKNFPQPLNPQRRPKS